MSSGPGGKKQSVQNTKVIKTKSKEKSTPHLPALESKKDPPMKRPASARPSSRYTAPFQEQVHAVATASFTSTFTMRISTSSSSSQAKEEKWRIWSSEFGQQMVLRHWYKWKVLPFTMWKATLFLYGSDTFVRIIWWFEDLIDKKGKKTAKTFSQPLLLAVSCDYFERWHLLLIGVMTIPYLPRM